MSTAIDANGLEIRDLTVHAFMRLVRMDATGCWTWTGQMNQDGYGKFRPKVDGVEVCQKAHRFSYMIFVGRLDPELTIDHLCRNRACVNPKHLEQVTNRENVMRGDTIPANYAARSHCKRGHPFDADNLRTSSGARRCKACCRDRARERRRGVVL